MDTVHSFVAAINNVIINPLIGLLFALALFYFVLGAFNTVRSAASDEKRREGRQHMIWGIVGMAIMVSVFGILQLLLNTFEVTPDELPENLPLNNKYFSD